MNSSASYSSDVLNQSLGLPHEDAVDALKEPTHKSSPNYIIGDVEEKRVEHFDSI